MIAGALLHNKTMKILQIIVICTATIARSKCAKNDGDSGKPYEFGFTIDGEQHRYEKRDANGIIQGEFGFITADGIYHVTTYATDENGSFRILSTRNVRISDPLDGSGGTYSNKVPASSVQGAGNKPQKIQQPLVTHQQLQQAPPPVHHNQFSSSAATTGFTLPSNVNPLIQTTTKRTPINFTLQSSVLPACASCGYVTRAPSTQKPVIQFAQSPNKPYRPPQNQISHASLTFPKGTSSKTTTASPFIFSSAIPQTSSVNNYKPDAYAPNINEQQRPVESVPQIQPIPQSNLITPENYHSAQNPTSPPQSISFIPTQSFPSGPPQVPQSQNNPSQILTYDPSQVSSPEKPSQFVEPPSFSPQQPQIHSNIDISNPASGSVPLAPINHPNELPQPLNNPPQISSFAPSLSAPAGLSQFSPETPTQSAGSPVFNPQQTPSGVFNPESESAPLTPIQVQNDKPQLSPFAGPPINNQADFDVNAPSRVGDIKVENGMIFVPNNPPIKIQDKYPGMVDGLPEGIEENDIVDLLYKFNYTIGFHGHYEKGWRNGTKVGGYFVNGRDGISRVVTYVADENGYRPRFRLVNLGLESPDTPKEDTEKKFGLKNFEFVWYPLK